MQAAKDSLQNLDDRLPYAGYTPGAFNTAFRYQLADETGKNVARSGLSDLDICLPYTLAFVRELESVEYPNRLVCLEEPEDAKVDGGVQILTVTIVDPDGFADPEVSSIAVVSLGLTTVTTFPLAEANHALLAVKNEDDQGSVVLLL